MRQETLPLADLKVLGPRSVYAGYGIQRNIFDGRWATGSVATAKNASSDRGSPQKSREADFAHENDPEEAMQCTDRSSRTSTWPFAACRCE